MSDKPALARDSTMAVTAKQAKDLLGKEAGKLGDTRAVTNVLKKSKLKRKTTVDKVAAEAQVFLGKEVNLSGGRQLRVRKASAPKPAPKRAGTMKVTAKEGKAFVKRANAAK